MSPHSAALITMLCTIRSAHHGEMNHCFACSFRFTHALTLCRYPLMREKCFGGVVAGVEPASIGALPIGLRAPCGFHREFLPQAYSLARR